MQPPESTHQPRPSREIAAYPAAISSATRGTSSSNPLCSSSESTTNRRCGRSAGALRDGEFVHGCFWHTHGCHPSKMPATPIAFWRRKIERTVARDQARRRGASRRRLARSCDLRMRTAGNGFGWRIRSLLAVPPISSEAGSKACGRSGHEPGLDDRRRS